MNAFFVREDVLNAHEFQDDQLEEHLRRVHMATNFFGFGWNYPESDDPGKRWEYI